MNYKNIFRNIAFTLGAIAFMVVSFGIAHTASAQYDDGYGYDSGCCDTSSYDNGSSYDSGCCDTSSYDSGCNSCNALPAYNNYDQAYNDYCASCYSSGSANPIYINNTNTNTNSNSNVNIVHVAPPAPVASAPALQVNCDADYSVADTDQTVRFSANASGGTGNYSYSWNGSDGLSGSGSSISRSFNSTGSKNATVTVTSGSRSATASCSTYIQNNNNNNNNFNVTCSASPSSVQEGDRVRWTANVDGVNESNVDYRWSGDVSGSSRTENETYDNSGTYEGTVRVTYNGRTESDTCSVRVENSNNHVVLNTVPVYTPPVQPQLSSVYLSQIPYTGAADNLKLIGFIGSLLALSLGGAYMYVTRKMKLDRKDFLANFKKMNQALKAKTA